MSRPMIYFHRNHERCLPPGPDARRGRDTALGDVLNGGCCSMGEAAAAAAKQREAGGDWTRPSPATPGSPGDGLCASAPAPGAGQADGPCASPPAPGAGQADGPCASPPAPGAGQADGPCPSPPAAGVVPADGFSTADGGAAPLSPPPPPPPHSARLLSSSSSRCSLKEPNTTATSSTSTSAGHACQEDGACPGCSGLRTGPGTNTLQFMDVSLNSRNSFEIKRRQSAPEHLVDGAATLAADALSASTDEGEAAAAAAAKPKKLGIAEFITRNFFTKKIKEQTPPTHSAPGWKLFGKIPPRENPQKDSKTIQQDSYGCNLASVSAPNLFNTGEYEARTGRMTKPSLQVGRRRNLEFEPLSTTALILEDRPAHLPAKNAEEAQRHRQEYDEMVAEAKKREMKEAQRRKKIMKERFKQEENIAHAMIIWNVDILPNWETIRNTRKVRELWWQGVPPSIRGKVWSLAIGNELNITHELYEIFLSRAKERWKSFRETGSENETEDSGASGADREASLELIKLDISRTFPSLFIFQKGGPYHDLLHNVLGAYTCYRPDVGYVQGMSFVAAVLILNLEEADAFIAFANLLNKPCQLAFFRVDHSMMLKYFASFEVFFEENLPNLFAHLKTNNLTPDIYLIDWIFTLYSKSLPLDLACRVWDVFCRDGEEFLFRTALGILKLYEGILVQMDFIHIAQFLTKLPEDITSEKLFACITTVQMQSSNKRWTQVFASLMKDGKEVEKNHSPALKS